MRTRERTAIEPTSKPGESKRGGGGSVTGSGEPAGAAATAAAVADLAAAGTEARARARARSGADGERREQARRLGVAALRASGRLGRRGADQLLEGVLALLAAELVERHGVSWKPDGDRRILEETWAAPSAEFDAGGSRCREGAPG